MLVPGKVEDGGEFPLQKALDVLRGCEGCESEKGFGLICVYLRLILSKVMRGTTMHPKDTHRRCMGALCKKHDTVERAEILTNYYPQHTYHAFRTISKRLPVKRLGSKHSSLTAAESSPHSAQSKSPFHPNLSTRPAWKFLDASLVRSPQHTLHQGS